MMELGSAANWAAVLIALVALVFSGLAWWRRSDREEAEDLQQMRTEVNRVFTDHGERLARVESQVQSLPTAQAISQLSERLGEVHADLRGLAGRFEGFQQVAEMMKQQVRMMDGYLRNKDSEKRQ